MTCLCFIWSLNLFFAASSLVVYVKEFVQLKPENLKATNYFILVEGVIILAKHANFFWIITMKKPYIKNLLEKILSSPLLFSIGSRKQSSRSKVSDLCILYITAHIEY